MIPRSRPKAVAQDVNTEPESLVSVPVTLIDIQFPGLHISDTVHEDEIMEVKEPFLYIRSKDGNETNTYDLSKAYCHSMRKTTILVPADEYAPETK